MNVRENLQQNVDSRMKNFHETEQKKQHSADDEDQLPLNLDSGSSSKKATTSGETPLTTDDMNSQLLTAANLFESSVLMSGCNTKVPTSSSNLHVLATSVDTSEVSSDVLSNDVNNQNSNVTTARPPRKQLHEQQMQAAAAVPHGEMTPKSHDVVKGTPKRIQNFSSDETFLDKKKCTPAENPLDITHHSNSKREH